MLTLIYFILILGLIILVHEFGHFFFAKKFGVHVYEFSLGMGPKIWGSKPDKDGTTYNIRAFPIGGFVSLAGEDPSEVNNEVPKKKFLYNKPIWQRCLIMFFGAGNNFLLAILLLFSLGLFCGSPVMDPVLSGVDVNYPMYEAGIRDGDKVLSIDGHKTTTIDDVAVYLTLDSYNGSDVKIKVQRDNKDYSYVVKPLTISYTFGVTFRGDATTPLVEDVDSNYPMSKAGIKKGDLITKIDGVEVSTIEEFNKYIIEHRVDGSEASFEVLRGEEVLSFDVKPLECDKQYSYGVSFVNDKKESGFISAIKYAFIKIGALLKQMVIVLKSLFTGKLGLSSLSGPVGIYGVVGESAKSGFATLVSLTAMLCVNVGFLNLIPFPAFDGGRILFLIIEKIKGSPVNPKVENTVNTVGFVLLMILMFVITCHDILNLF